MAEKLQGVNKKYPKVLCVRIACTNECRSVNTRAHTHTLAVLHYVLGARIWIFIAVCGLASVAVSQW